MGWVAAVASVAAAAVAAPAGRFGAGAPSSVPFLLFDRPRTRGRRGD